jgi:hypothetical protein
MHIEKKETYIRLFINIDKSIFGILYWLKFFTCVTLRNFTDGYVTFIGEISEFKL